MVLDLNFFDVASVIYMSKQGSTLNDIILLICYMGNYFTGPYPLFITIATLKCNLIAEQVFNRIGHSV